MAAFDTATIEQHGLAPDEYQRIVDLLGREPTITELGLFSVMWSEHCSYKSSRVHLKTLPTTGPRVLEGPGENAGAVDIGDGMAAVFKIESHNHPSFIEPYQGAATGVGGIIRDIFTMGARPIALMNSLRFGPLDVPKNRRILEGVVAGIGGYGNSIGIATVGGEVMFDETYSGNPLVNVFCLGIVRADGIVRAKASGVGNPVYYLGAKTGRDGIHGATMASAEFDEKSAEKRPAVQVGDPFMEKLLLEACLELMKSDAVVAVQDMGAAGLACSTCETGARGGVGIEIDVAHVPVRESGMTPYEIMLSESQERMLLVVKKGREREVEEIFDKWDLHAARIGEVTPDKLLRVKHNGTVVAEVPSAALADEAPIYKRPFKEPAAQKDLRTLPVLDAAPSTRDAFFTLLAAPGIASKQWIYRQYDSMVRTNTLVAAGAGAGVVRVKGTNKALAMSVDGNGRYCVLDPYEGAKLAVAEAARNVACAGAAPIGVTNCLNFGNPERPEIMWQFAEAVRGIGDACRALDLPVTGGNVSLYNETDGQAILPTPVIGVLGLMEDAGSALSRVFPRAPLDIVLLGSTSGEFGGSEYLKTLHGLVRGVPPALDLERERALQSLLIDAASKKWTRSAHDCADGGFAVALSECCFSGGGGADVAIAAPKSSSAFDAVTSALFSESASRALVTIAAESKGAFMARAAELGVPASAIGRSGGDRIRISVDGTVAIDCATAEAEERWRNGLTQYFAERVA
ncbi:MAG: phosphoribosylformylglycinamidine synthase subunit PurL [Vicinamibacterales bacterium]